MTSNPTPDPEFAVPTATSADDLADRLEAILTERFTELGNPFSRMRIAFQGPDGWPASKEVGPHDVALVLRELLAAAPAVPSVSAVDQTTRDRIAAAIRAAACPGADCPLSEEECAERRIQPGAWERGVLSEVYGRPEQFADAVLAVLPPTVDRAAVLREAADAVFALDYDVMVGEVGDENFGSMREAWDVGTIHATNLLRRLADEAQQPEPDDEGDELVCVDECGSCDACGMEPFGTPAEGWREAARFLRRTARESGDRQSALHGARLIEAELRRVAEEARDEQEAQTHLDQLADELPAVGAQQPDTETPGCPDPIECSHEAALGEAREEIRRLGLMVDEYGQGASALTDKLKRARDRHRETCIVALGQVAPTAFSCGLCEILDAPAAPAVAERPRCPHCQMPHDLGPGSSAALACASIRASIADRDAASAVPGRSAATSTDEETRTDVGTEFVHQLDHVDGEALARVEAELQESGVGTPGCDCGHDGMGVRWHDTACEWRSIPPCDACGTRGHSFEDCPKDGPQ